MLHKGSPQIVQGIGRVLLPPFSLLISIPSAFPGWSSSLPNVLSV